MWYLLKFCGNLSGGIVVGILVVDLETGEHRVFEADVNADDMVDERRRFVSFERGRDCKTSLNKHWFIVGYTKFGITWSEMRDY